MYVLTGLDDTMIRDEFEAKYRIKWSRNYAETFDAWEYSKDFLEENGYLPIEVEKLTLEKLINATEELVENGECEGQE